MMHIAFCTDTNYVMPCGVAIVSICENNKEEDIVFHLVITSEPTFSEETKWEPIKDIVESYGQTLNLYYLDKSEFSSLKCTGPEHITISTYSRFFLPKILPNDVKQVLYLDCDLVCNGSLKELCETELSVECPLGAIVDSYYASTRLHISSQIPQSAHYFNGGVLLINLDCWRKNNYTELLVKTASEHQFPLMDQDTLNNIFWDKVLLLPWRYNVQIVAIIDGIDNCHTTMDYFEEMKEACSNPTIIHYLTANKPWHDEWCPYREVWDKYLALTIWKDYKPTPVNTQLGRSNISKDFIETYWSDSILFKEGLYPYLRFFNALVKLKHKRDFISISSMFLNAFAAFLEKVYSWKTRK